MKKRKQAEEEDLRVKREKLQKKLEKQKEEELKSEEAKNARLQAEKREREEKKRVEDIIIQGKRHASVRKDDIVKAAASLKDCDRRLSDVIEEFVNDFVGSDDLLMEVPPGAIDEIRRVVKPIYESSYNIFVKRRNELKKSIDWVIAEIKSNEEKIIMIATCEENCMELVEEKRKDLFLKQKCLQEIPIADIRTHFINCEREFQKSFKSLQNNRREKISDLIGCAQGILDQEKDTIMAGSNSSDEYVNSMSQKIEDIVHDLCRKEDILQSIPDEIEDFLKSKIENLKCSLEPSFRKAFDAAHNPVPQALQEVCSKSVQVLKKSETTYQRRADPNQWITQQNADFNQVMANFGATFMHHMTQSQQNYQDAIHKNSPPATQRVSMLQQNQEQCSIQQSGMQPEL